MFDSAINSMVGLVPIAMAGGIVTGLTREAMAIPSAMHRSPVHVDTEVIHSKKRRKNSRGEVEDIWTRVYGIPAR